MVWVYFRVTKSEYSLKDNNHLSYRNSQRLGSRFIFQFFKGKISSLDVFVQVKEKKSAVFFFFKLLLLIPYISGLVGN